MKPVTLYRLAAVLALALAPLPGCGDAAETQNDYPDGVAPTDETQPETPAGRDATDPDGEAGENDSGIDTDPGANDDTDNNTHTVEGLVYTVPEGWTVGDPKPMRTLTLLTDHGLEIAVGFWPNGVGGLEANLTRWLGMAGYNPADAAAMREVRAGFETFALGDAQATWMPLLDAGGTPMIGVWAPRGENPTAQSETWTLKITGDADALRDNADALRAWAESLSFE